MEMFRRQFFLRDIFRIRNIWRGVPFTQLARGTVVRQVTAHEPMLAENGLKGFGIRSRGLKSVRPFTEHAAMDDLRIGRVSVPRRWRFLLLGLVTFLVRPALAMEMRILGDQLILSGPVTGDELSRVQDALTTLPGITTVVLRNSLGGDAPTGYRMGELFRAQGMRTAVSGYCYSSCSRMFLGGRTRQFTSDYPMEHTQVGFHGHYGRDGRLSRSAVANMGLTAWIIEHSDGKADPALVERWANIPLSRGLAHFYHPTLQTEGRSASAFMCQGNEGATVFGCEAISRSAFDLGIVTSLDLISSNDQAEIRASVPGKIAPSGWASLLDVSKVPTTPSQALDDYRRFLLAPLPRAFVVSPLGKHWAWSGGTAEALMRALASCRHHSGQACTSYAIDDAVVWQTKEDIEVVRQSLR